LSCPYVTGFLAGIKPDPKLNVCEWAEKERILAGKGSSEPGRYRVSRTPYCKRSMELMSPFSYANEEHVMKGTQLGFSEVANNISLFYIKQVPSPILLLMMTKEVAKNHSANKLTPAIQVMPEVLAVIKDAKQKDDGGGTFLKEFMNGFLNIAWAQSTASYANASIRILLLDDCDRFPEEVGEEGDPIKLAIKRTNSFGRKRKIYSNSTPTTKRKSKILKNYLRGNQEHYYMPCPHCTPRHVGKQTKENMVRFEFEHFHFEYSKEYVLESEVFFVCPHCGSMIEEKYKTWMMAEENGARYFPTAKPVHPSVFSRRVPSYYSPIGWLSWREIFQDFLEAKKLMNAGNSSEMRTWKNTLDAQPWEEDYTSVKIKHHDLMDRREKYKAQVPEGVYLLVAGVDTQDDRYEIEVLGIGKHGETWSIETYIIRSDPNLKDTEDLLDSYLNSTFVHECGNSMKIYAAAIDTGGHRTLAVSRYCKKKYAKRVYAIKGAKPVDAPVVNKQPSKNKYDTRFYQVGVNMIKDEFYANLALTEKGPGYCHFPYKEENENEELYGSDNKGLYDRSYFEQLTVEVQDETGRWLNPARKRNEATDIRVYAKAAYELCPRDVEKMSEPLYHTSIKKTTKRRRRILSRGVE